MTRTFSRGLVLAAGLLASTERAAPDTHLLDQPTGNDPRTERIRSFFADCDCPAEAYAKDFIRVADQNGLDWRLLPSIAFIESTGGKALRNNNMFGWDNGEVRFRTLQEGIYVVGSRLSRARQYQGKSTDQKLRVYNTHDNYAVAIKATMRRLSPVPAL